MEFFVLSLLVRGMTLEKHFGEKVRVLRDSLDITQEDLAAMAKVHPTYLSGIETGVRNPTLKVVAKIATALNTEPHELLKGWSKPEPTQ